jgi:hypothetical protein
LIRSADPERRSETPIRNADPKRRSETPHAGRRFVLDRPAVSGRARYMLHGSEFQVMMRLQPAGTTMSSAVYTATVLTSARMAAGMTSRARRPLDGYPAG